MPYVTCPTCGERGKIPSSLIGARIRCKKCGLSFLVSGPAGKAAEAPAPAAAAAMATVTTGPSAVVEAQGIEVEGLDASSWSLHTEAPLTLKAEGEPAPEGGREAPAGFVRAPSPGGLREYKLLTSRDKYFDGRFDLARLEEALNHYGRQGWVAKTMSTPHVKGFSGALEEVIVVILERGKEGG
jgi:hypothetical protein